MLFLISEQLISDREIVIWIWWGIFEAIFLRPNRSDRVGKSIFCSILWILVDPWQSRLIILLSVEYRSNRVQPDKSAYKTSTCFRLSRNHSSNLRYRHINEFNVVHVSYRVTPTVISYQNTCYVPDFEDEYVRMFTLSAIANISRTRSASLDSMTQSARISAWANTILWWCWSVSFWLNTIWLKHKTKISMICIAVPLLLRCTNIFFF